MIGGPLRPPLAPAPIKAKVRRRQTVPEAIRGQVIDFAKRLGVDHAASFAGDPRLKYAVGRIFQSALLPSRRAGRPGYPEVSRAIQMLDKLRGLHPEEPSASLWQQIYPAVIADYGCLSEPDRRAARQELRNRVRWRCGQARRRRRRRSDRVRRATS